MNNTPDTLPDAFEDAVRRAFGDKFKTDETFCCEFWSALANVEWYHPKSGLSASYSFRAAGGLIAELRGEGDYMDWYCCGPYSHVTEFIRRSMKKDGWIFDATPMICAEPGCLNDAGCGWSSPDGYRFTCGSHYRDAHERKPMPAPETET